MAERLRIVIEGDGSDARTELRKTRQAVRDLTEEQKRAGAVQRDANGRLRDARGRYVGVGKAADDAAKAQRRFHGSSVAATAALDRQRQTLGGVASAAKAAGLALGAMGTYGVAKAVKDGFEFNAQMESSELAMRRFIGTTQETREYVEGLFEIAKETPFEFTDLTDASRRLLAFGMDAKTTSKTLAAVGDAVAAAGGDPEKIQRVVMAIGQIQAKNKVYAEELLQLTEAGIPAYRILKDQLGLTAEQVANIGKQGIDAKTGIEALTRGMNGMFKGAAADQATTWTGLMSTMRDSWAQMTGSITKSLFDEAKEWAPVVNQAQAEIAEVWKRDKLSFDEKFDVSMDIVDKRLGPLFDEIKQRARDLNLDEAFADAMKAAIPVVAEGAKDLAVAAARGFFDAFREADPLTKAILALVAAQKTGALAAITAYGRNAGQQAAAGMAGGITAGDPLATAAGGGARGKWMATAKGVGKGVLGVGLLAGMADAITSDQGNFAERVGRFGSTATFGILPDPKTESDKFFNQLVEQIRQNNTGTTELKRVFDEKASWLERNSGIAGWLSKTGKLKVGELEIDTSKFTADQKRVALDIARLQDTIWEFNRESKLELNIDEVSSERALNRVRFGFEQLDESATKSITHLRRRVNSNLKLIETAMGRDTAAGRQAAARNFNLAAAAIRKSMDDGVISTKEGLAEIRRLMVQKLQEFGFSEEQAKNIRKGQRYDGGANEGGAPIAGTNRAGGGWIGRPGETGRDKVPAMLGRGEAVLNRHQQRVVNAALAATGQGNLNTLFSRVKTPHYLASGGFAGEPQGFAGGGVVEAGRRLRGMGYAVGEHPAFGGVAPVHTQNSYHYRGLALDVNADNFPGGEGPALDKAAAWLRREYAGKILELLWRTAGHYDHLHVAIGGSGTGGTGGIAGIGEPPEIRRVLTQAKGKLGDISQGALDTFRAAAQKKVEDAFAESASGMGEPVADGGADEIGSSAQVRDWVAAGLRLAGIPANPANVATVAARAMQESSGNPRAINNWDINAQRGDPSKGLMQTISSTFNAYKVKGADDIWNPVHNVAAAVRYMMARYGRLVGAGPGGYAAGGFVGMDGMDGLEDILFAAGGAAGNAKRNLAKGPPVAVGPRRGKAQKTTGKQVIWKPKDLRFTGKLRNALPQIDQLFNLDAVINAMQGSYGQTADAFELTDENATRTLPVAQVSDEQLRSLGLSDDQIGRLRAAEGQEIEVLNQGTFSDGRGIREHVAELTALIERKKQIGGHMNTKRMVAEGLVQAIQAAVEERKQRLREIADRISEVRRRIQANTREIRSTQRDLTSEEKKKRPDKKRIRRLKDRLTDLRDEREHLTGHRTLEGSDDPTPASMLGVALKYRDTTREGLKAYEEELPNAQQTLAGVPGDLYDGVTQPINQMAKEIGDWLGTAAPKITVPDAQNDGRQDEINRLKAQLYDEERRKRLVAETQFGVFEGFAPLAAGRLMGSFARGIARVPHDGVAMLHRDETVVPSFDGPFRMTARDMTGGAGSPVNVELRLEGDAAHLVRLVDARVDGKVARVSQDMGKRARLMTIAPGRG